MCVTGPANEGDEQETSHKANNLFFLAENLLNIISKPLIA